ncbi:MAG: hypothetical protein IJ489_04065 [Clostridia bacterium]|nr:hypothetical protein [Clostridia bacterium]
MKKTVQKMLVCMMALALVLGCASCTLFKNYDYVNEAIAKTRMLDAADLAVTTNVNVTAGETTEDLSSSYTVKMKGLQTTAPAFSADMDVTLYGETVPASVYYEAPYYYVKTELDAVKLEKGDLLEKADFASEWKQMNTLIPEEILKTAIETDKGDGIKSVTLTFDANSFTAAYDTLLRTWHEKLVADHVGEYSESSLTVSEAKAEIAINETSGYLAYYAVSCKLDIASKNTLGEDKLISAHLSYLTSYRDAGADITLDIPENHTDFEPTDGLTLDPYKLMTQAIEKAKALNDFKADIRIGIAFDMGGFRMDMPVSIALCASGVHTENHTFQYTMKTSMLGMEIAQDIYYIDGFYYMNDGTYKVKYPQNAENEKEYGYQSDIDILLKILPENYFEGVEVQRNADGTKSFSLSVEAMWNYYADFTEKINEMIGSDCLWANGTLTVVIDKDGSLKSYDIAFKPTGRIEGILTTYDITYGITYKESGDSVTPEIPADLNEYKTIEEINSEGFGIINSAIENILNTDQMNVISYLESEQKIGSANTLAFTQNYTLVGNQLKTFSPVYRYLLTTEVNGTSIAEDVYYENGYYYIDSEILSQPVKIAEENAANYNILERMTRVLQKLPNSVLAKVETESIKGEGSSLYFELDETDFQTIFPKLWNVSVSGYQTGKKIFHSAVLEVTADANGNLLTYTLSYDIDVFIIPIGGYKLDTLYLTETISYVFDTSDTAIVIAPPENYKDYADYKG